VRVGIATGPVVAGDLIGQGVSEEKTIVGETPNLAARLQVAADPNTVVISGDTRRLLGAAFEYADLGGVTVKGFSEPVEAWRALAPKDAETRFEATHAAGLTPLVGREEEMDTLLRRWRRARTGEGQVVHISGEAGFGKSRIAQALRDHVAGEAHLHIRYQCSPYFTNSALYPVVEQLTHAAGWAHGDSPERKLDKLEAMLKLAMDDISAVVPLFASLLSVPSGERYTHLELAPEQQKETTFAALLEQMERLAARQPMLLLFEDVHWIDPTSLELLHRMVDRVQAARVLVIVTSRPEFRPSWVGQPHVALLTLSRINRRECEAMAERVVSGKRLPREVLDQIVTKTDGVPLFVEELTKTIVESDLLTKEADRFILVGSLPPLAIPVTLRDSLMARLDRLGSVKQVAQIGAVIGREFTRSLLAAVSRLPENELEDSLSQLVRSELVLQKASGQQASYVFKHMLVQDTAYESLLKTTRQQLHGDIARALEKDFSEIARTRPELLAYHTK